MSTATICEIAGDECALPLDGDSLLPLLTTGDLDWKDEAFCEYLAHGTDRPMAMLRRGRYKLNYSWGDPVELYDVVADPVEFNDLSSEPAHQERIAEMKADLLADWDPAALDRRVRASQRQQRYIEENFGIGWREARWAGGSRFSLTDGTRGGRPANPYKACPLHLQMRAFRPNAPA